MPILYFILISMDALLGLKKLQSIGSPFDGIRNCFYDIFTRNAFAFMKTNWGSAPKLFREVAPILILLWFDRILPGCISNCVPSNRGCSEIYRFDNHFYSSWLLCFWIFLLNVSDGWTWVRMPVSIWQVFPAIQWTWFYLPCCHQTIVEWIWVCW